MKHSPRFQDLRSLRLPARAGLLALLLPVGAAAQLNVTWVAFAPDATKLASAPTAVSSATDDVDFATGDLNQDGWIDVVAVRKPPGSAFGKRANILLMNESGVLTDRSAQYASATDVPGDNGFLTPTGDRDVAIADVNGDGWLDVITVVSLSESESKVLSHPRIYVNLKNDAGGAWQGLRFENTRIPQMVSKTGVAVGPRFIDVGVGDVDLDGDLDLHFVDHDETTTGISENAAWDYDDRLLINDGNGFFADATAAHMTSAQVFSEFGTGSIITDMNADGAPEIVRGSANGVPQGIFVEYNDPAQPGQFQLYGEQKEGSSNPYAFDVGDLNNDGRPDLVSEDDVQDQFQYSTGLDALHKLTWGPLLNFSYASGGSDFEFGGNVYIHDLDGDGWNDVLIANYDVDSPSFGCTSRTHIYHNPGGTPGAQIQLREEAQLGNGLMGSGWKGVVGMAANQLTGTYDIALADFDRDGDDDMLIGRCTGTDYWKNLTDPTVCQEDIGFGGPGTMHLTICGDSLLQAGGSAQFHLTGAAPNHTAFIPVSLTSTPAPFKGGTLAANPMIFLLSAFSTNALGELNFPIPGSGNQQHVLYMQALVKNGTTWEFSNAVQLDIAF